MLQYIVRLHAGGSHLVNDDILEMQFSSFFILFASGCQNKTCIYVGLKFLECVPVFAPRVGLDGNTLSVLLPCFCQIHIKEMERALMGASQCRFTSSAWAS